MDKILKEKKPVVCRKNWYNIIKVKGDMEYADGTTNGL
jgi:hypothetical protein